MSLNIVSNRVSFGLQKDSTRQKLYQEFSEYSKSDNTSSLDRKIKGGVIGGLLFAGMTWLSSKALYPLISKASSSADSLLSFDETKKIATEIINTSSLKDKGFKVNFIDETLQQELNKAKKLIYNELKDSQKLGKNTSKKLSESIINLLKQGKGAFCLFDSNQAIASKGKSFLVLHELNHAIHSSKNKFMNFYVKHSIKTTAILGGVLCLTGLTHNIKPNKNKNAFEKSKDFISNNAGKLTLFASLPMLIEEALTSIQTLNKVKKVGVEAKKIKSLTKLYGKYLGAYILSAGVLAFGVASAVKVKEDIIHPKPIK